MLQHPFQSPSIPVSHFFAKAISESFASATISFFPSAIFIFASFSIIILFWSLSWSTVTEFLGLLTFPHCMSFAIFSSLILAHFPSEISFHLILQTACNLWWGTIVYYSENIWYSLSEETAVTMFNLSDYCYDSISLEGESFSIILLLKSHLRTFHL